MVHLRKDENETPSLSAVWAMCEDVEHMLAACADICERVSAPQTFPRINLNVF